ncbi:MAG: Zn(2(+)) ABC transporter periplasmic binding protein [Sodalis sp. Psp]|nr:Zn(2(+)) ABC transporter periplasmic binding protein [Sodalis sp. Psp]MCR3756976.1 Zn(2(+)) ABC transporter periplasmic binding protein [Sodalis sp. Ppy]
MKIFAMPVLNYPLLSVSRTGHFVFLVAVLGLTSCVDVQATIVTSIRPLGFIAAAISDGVIPVEVVLPDGASPHDYALRPTDLMRIKKADVLVWVGPDMEAFLIRPATLLPADKRITLASLPSITPLLIRDRRKLHENYVNNNEADSNFHQSYSCHHGEYNMHIWLSPEIARRAAEAIHDRLVDFIPEKKQQLDDNLQIFNSILTKNDEIIDTMLSAVRSKGYFVFHDAYGYFEKYYGLRPLGYFTTNPEIQPGAHTLHKIITRLGRQKVTCVFSEPQFRPTVVNVITSGVSIHVGTLDPLGIGIALNKESYTFFLLKLSDQYVSCLKKNM